MNNLLASTPFMIFGALVLLYIVLAMGGGGRTRAGSSKSLSGSLSKVLMGSGSKKKSSKRSSGGNKKYMGFTMTQILVGAAVVAGIYYYKEGFDASVDKKFNEACDSRDTAETKKVQKLPLMGMDDTKKAMAPLDSLPLDPRPKEG